MVQNANALNVLDHYAAQLAAQQSQQQHFSPSSHLYQQTAPQHSQGGLASPSPFFSHSSYTTLPDDSSSSTSSSSMFDRQSSFQLPDSLSFNPFSGRDSSMNPSTLTDPSGSHHPSHSSRPNPSNLLPSSDPYSIDSSAARLTSGGHDYLTDLSSASHMEMSRDISGLAMGMDMGGGGDGFSFDRSLSAILSPSEAQHQLQQQRSQQHSASLSSPPSSQGEGGNGNGISPGSSMSGLSSSSSQSHHVPSHASSSVLSHSSTSSSSSSGEFEEELNAELLTLHHDVRGLSAVGFDLNLERFPSAGMGGGGGDGGNGGGAYQMNAKDPISPRASQHRQGHHQQHW